MRISTFGMPLHRQYEVAGRIQLDRLNDPIFGRDRAHQQIVSGHSNRLMVARVNLRFKLVHGLLIRRQKRSQPRPLLNPNRMRLDHFTAWPVIHRRFQILNQRAVPPDIDGLGAGTDTQDWLLEIERVLQEQLIHCGAFWVCLPALGYWIFAISLRVHIEAAAREKNPLHSRENLGHTILPLVERNHYRRCPGGSQGGEIKRQRALIVGMVAAGGLGDGNANGHGSTSVMKDVG